MAPRAILFDFDGVIADTENHHVAAWQRTLLALGWHVPDEIAARSAEIDDRQFLGELFEAHDILDGDIQGWLQKKQELTLELLRDAPRVYPGVASLVGRLTGRVRLGVVSGTSRRNVDTVLEASGLASRFELIISKEDVKAVKPEPEAYLLALARLGLPARDVVAIEDSPSGLAAARGAEISCVAVGHRREFGEWVGGAVYFSGLEPISGLMEHFGLD